MLTRTDHGTQGFLGSDGAVEGAWRILDGQAHFRAMRNLAAEHPSEKVGAEIRKLYSWNNEDDKLINN